MRWTEPITHLRADLIPVSWKAPTAYTVRTGGRFSSRVAPSAELNAYKEALREVLTPQWRWDPIDFPVELQWRFSRQLVTYESESGRKVTKHQQDLTNLVKAAEDALQPTILRNDKWVRAMYAEIVEQSKEAKGWVSLVIVPYREAR